MSDSEHKPIEKLLRSAAAKRRAEAGSPEMHPATRETLLTEVRRQYGAAHGRAPRPWWLRLAPALAVLVVLAGGTWILLRDQPSPTMELAKVESSDSRQEGLEKRSLNGLSAEVALNVPQQERDALAPAPEPGEAAMAPTEEPARQPARPATRSAALADMASRTDLALAPAPAPKGEAATFTGGVSPAATRIMAPSAMEPAAAPAADPAWRLAVSSTPVPSESSDVTARKQKTTASVYGFEDVSQNINEVAVPVLQNFVVATRDQRVWFIDEDGSVYEGRMQSAPGAAAEAGADSEAKPLGVQIQALAAAPTAGRTAEVQTVSYTFDASGINQSLRRSIRFTGRMVLTEQQARQDRNAFANTLPPVQQRMQAGSQSFSLPATGVDGTLRLDDGTTLRVQAVPAGP